MSSALTYNNLDGVIRAGESANAVLTNTIECVTNPSLCAARAITEFVVVGLNTVDKIQMNQVIKKELESQDYMIKEQIKFEKWAAQTEQKIIQRALRGELESQRITQKSKLKLMGILRDYYILKSNQYVKENALQVKRIKTLIITLVSASLLIGSVYFLTRNL